MFSLHFRVCRYKKGIRGLAARAPLWRTDGAHRGPGSCAPEFPLATGGRGRTRHSGKCQMSTKTVSGWCLVSNVNQNTTWIMFDIKHQPELYLVDVWYQTSTKTLSLWCLISNVNQNCIPVDVWYQTSIRTLSGWCLISIIKRVATGSWLIFIYSRYMFSLHFRVCRFKKVIWGQGARAPLWRVAFLQNATIEYSSKSVCVCFRVFAR